MQLFRMKLAAIHSRWMRILALGLLCMLVNPVNAATRL
jgi:hypothetical protein